MFRRADGRLCDPQLDRVDDDLLGGRGPDGGRDLASNAGALGLFLMAIVSPFAGEPDRPLRPPNRLRRRPVLRLPSGILATSAATRDWQLIAFYGGLIGIGSGAIAMPMVSAAVARYFAHGRGLASGIGFSRGHRRPSLSRLPVLGALVVALGWRGHLHRARRGDARRRGDRLARAAAPPRRFPRSWTTRLSRRSASASAMCCRAEPSGCSPSVS